MSLHIGEAKPSCVKHLQEIFNSDNDGVLSGHDFGKLDKLIEQTSQFSTFLSEQMKVRALTFSKRHLMQAHCPLDNVMYLQSLLYIQQVLSQLA